MTNESKETNVRASLSDDFAKQSAVVIRREIIGFPCSVDLEMEDCISVFTHRTKSYRNRSLSAW